MSYQEIIDWLQENRSWLFSGLGVSIITFSVLAVRGISFRIWKESFYLSGYDYYISTPVVSLGNNDSFKRNKKLIKSLIDLLKQTNNRLRIYSYINEVSDIPESGASSHNIKIIYSSLRKSKKYIGIFPSKKLSGAHCEAGFAMALGKPCVFFVKDPDDLPTILRKAPSVYSFVNIQKYKDEEDLLRLFRESGQDLFIKRLV